MELKERLLQIANHYNLSIREFEKISGLKRGNISNMTGAIGSDKLAKIIDAFPEVDLHWLVSGMGEPFPIKKEQAPHSIKYPIMSSSNHSIGKTLRDSTETAGQLTNFIDVEKCTTIPIIDVSAAAGYGAINQDHFTEQDIIRLPPRMVKKGLHHCIRIKGISMSPTLQDGGYLINRLLDRSEWRNIKDSYVYVITNRDGETFIKRVKNRLKEHGFIVCTSDNPDKIAFPNFNIMEDEIHNVWQVEWYLSAKMPNIHDTYYNRIQGIEDELGEMRSMLNRILSK